MSRESAYSDMGMYQSCMTFGQMLKRSPFLQHKNVMYYRIRVNCVSPGMVFQRKFDREIPITHTEKNALQRFGYTDEVAALIAFLCSDDAQFITGQNITIDGGRSIGLK